MKHQMKKIYTPPMQRSIILDEQQLIAQSFTVDPNKTFDPEQDGGSFEALSRDDASDSWDDEW